MSLLNDDVMLVKSPKIEDRAEYDMYNEVVKKLKDEKIMVAQSNDKVQTLTFAIH